MLPAAESSSRQISRLLSSGSAVLFQDKSIVFAPEAAHRARGQQLSAPGAADSLVKPYAPFAIESGHDIQDPLEMIDMVDKIAAVYPYAS